MSDGMLLRHYRGTPLAFDREWVYDQGAYPQAKPDGFWVSVLGDDDWPSWCRSEDWGIDRLAFEHRVTLAADANLLILDSEDLLVGFSETYGAGGLRVADRHYSDHGVTAPKYIRWEAVARAYDGIVIAPYQRRARWEHPWYSGWDVASGCIWNLHAIASVELLARAADEVAS